MIRLGTEESFFDSGFVELGLEGLFCVKRAHELLTEEVDVSILALADLPVAVRRERPREEHPEEELADACDHVQDGQH